MSDSVNERATSSKYNRKLEMKHWTFAEENTLLNWKWNAIYKFMSVGIFFFSLGDSDLSDRME